MNRILLACAITAGAIAVVSPASADPQTYVKLSNNFRGAGMALDIRNGGASNNFARMAPAQEVSGQYWRIDAAKGNYVRLSTLFRGRQMCLDVANGGPRNNYVQLTPCAEFSGQYWAMKNDRDGYRLTTMFRGQTMCLDVVNGGPNDNDVWLAKCGAYSGQIWHTADTGKPVE